MPNLPCRTGDSPLKNSFDEGLLIPTGFTLDLKGILS